MYLYLSLNERAVIVANPGYGDKGAIHKHHVVIRLKSSFFCPAQKAYLTRIICCHLHQ